MALDGDDGLDTKLARLLHQRGRVELGVLQTLLSEVRTGESTLAGSLVTRGVIQQDEAERFLHELGAIPVAREDGVASSLWTSGETSGERLAWREGTEVGDYRLERKLGQGAMGMVFLATHVPTGSPCALKTLSFQADEELRTRFVREGQAQARVDSHPNVVRVHSAGEAGGALYMIMDLASGGDLEERLRLGPLPPLDAARMIAGLSRGMAHVHKHGVLHRDLKPANVLFGDNDVPKLVDFGLARIGSESSNLTRTGEVLGTPSYMSPEQAQGLKEDVGPRSDVYGLGAILYHCMTGSPPFTGVTAMSILTHVIMDPPEPPRSLVPEIPANLEAICLKALAKVPDDRYANATEFADALEGLVAPPRRVSQRIQKPERSEQETLLLRVGAGAGSVLVLLLILAAIFGGKKDVDVVKRPRIKRPRPAKVEPPPPPPVVDPTPPEPPPTVVTFEHVPFSEGESFRGRIRVRGRQDILMRLVEINGGSATPRGVIDMSLDFTFAVDSNDSQEASVSATINELSVMRSSMTGSGIAFVSTAAVADPPSPFRKALGSTLQLRLNRYSSKVLDVYGSRNIQMAVWAEARGLGLRPVEVGLDTIEGFDDPDSIKSILNKVFFVVPETEVPSDGKWSLEGDNDFVLKVVEGSKTEFEAFGAGLLVRPTRAGAMRHCVATQTGPTDLDLSWTSEGVTRRASGRAVIKGSRLRSSVAEEEFTLRFGNEITKEPQAKVFARTTAHYTRLDD